jgi:hypothetical protein
VHKVVQVEAHLSVLADVVEDARQAGPQVVALALPELPEQVRGNVQARAPRTVPLCRKVRLVGEHGGDLVPQPPELSPVRLVSRLQKGLRRPGVEQARVDGVAVPGERLHGAHHEGDPARSDLRFLNHLPGPPTVPRVQGEPIFGDTIPTFAEDGADVSAPGLGYAGRDVAASEPARVGVLIVEVGHKP